MKFHGFKFNLGLSLIAVVLTVVDIVLMINYGFEGQLLIALYVLIGVVPICSLVFMMAGLGPTILIDKASNTINTIGIADERYKMDKNMRNTQAIIHLDEIFDCRVYKKNMIFKIKYANDKVLDLSAFSFNQILMIQKEIEKIITNQNIENL